MDIEEAFRHALDGDAILFLGAGFSLGASNNRGDEFPLANDLSHHLMEALGETEPVQLQNASELYVKSKGEVGLLEFLNQHLGVRSVALHHKSFARPNWRRIYTTNYDSVFETAAREEGRRVRPLILSPQIPAPESGEIDCIHINGFLRWANAQNLNSTVILSETAYLTNRFVESPWAWLLRSDLEAARAVIFAGYSLADLDIGRILVAVESVKRKCVFIVGPNPSLASRTTIEKFGILCPVAGVEPAAEILNSVAKVHEPTGRHVDFSSFRAVPEIAVPANPPTAKNVFDLLVKGEVDIGYLSRSLSQPEPSYVVPRAEIEQVADALARGAPVVAVLSRLANGKTLLSECIAAKLRDRFDVFVFTKNTLSLADEVRVLRAPSRPTLIVIDDYTRQIDLIRELRLGAGANQHLLLTSRTPTHLTTRDRLQTVLGESRPLEFRIDALREGELGTLDTILASAGLLGDTAAWSKERRVQELYRSKGASEFGGILLWLLESPAIRAKLAETFAALRGRDDPQRVVIAAMVLTHIGQPPDLDDIAEFIGARSINQTILSEDAVAADLICFDRRRAYPRSSLFAVAALRALWDEGHVPNVLEAILRRAWDLRFPNKRFRGVARDLMRYSKIRQIVPTDEPSRYVLSYYEQIRNLPSCVNNELFWLQFSLADIEREQFDVAERHLEQSYAIASRMKGYKTYQIDNVYAQFLLRREIEQQNRDRAFRSFVEASKIINSQMRDREQAYYPYRVASHYGEFWKRLASHWGTEQKSVFINACRAVYRFSQGVDPDLAAMDDVRRCGEIVKTILIEAGAIPAT
jgi:tetratricopeptide (TPR) repeat protein